MNLEATPIDKAYFGKKDKNFVVIDYSMDEKEWRTFGYDNHSEAELAWYLANMVLVNDIHTGLKEKIFGNVSRTTEGEFRFPEGFPVGYEEFSPIEEESFLHTIESYYRIHYKLLRRVNLQDPITGEDISGTMKDIIDRHPEYRKELDL